MLSEVRTMVRRRINDFIDYLHTEESKGWRPDRKGRGLVLMSMIWLLIGLGVPEQPPLDSAFHQAIPTWMAVFGWVATGMIGLIAAWVKNLRPWAMAALTVMPGIRAVSYATAWIIYLVPGGSPGYDRGWIAVLGQVIMIAFVFYVAADKEDTTVKDLNHVFTHDHHEHEGEHADE